MASVQELIDAERAQRSPAISAMEGLARGYLNGQQQALERAKTLIMLEQNRREQEMMIKNQQRINAQYAADLEASRKQDLNGAAEKPASVMAPAKTADAVSSQKGNFKRGYSTDSKGHTTMTETFSPFESKPPSNEVQYTLDQNGKAVDIFTKEPITERAQGVNYKYVSTSSLETQNKQDGQKILPANSVLALNEGKNVARLLPDVEAAIKANEGKFGPVTGRLRTANPYDVDAQTFDARMRSASQSFGKFMESGVLRKEDEEKYRKMFPQASDDDQVKKNKLEIIKRQLAQKYEDDRKTLGRSGYDVSGFETLDIAPSIFKGDNGSSSGDGGLAIGTIKKGFRFRGGNPGSRESWEKVQ